jgi:hypothetical protein
VSSGVHRRSRKHHLVKKPTLISEFAYFFLREDGTYDQNRVVWIGDNAFAVCVSDCNESVARFPGDYGEERFRMDAHTNGVADCGHELSIHAPHWMRRCLVWTFLWTSSPLSIQECSPRENASPSRGRQPFLQYDVHSRAKPHSSHLRKKDSP